MQYHYDNNPSVFNKIEHNITIPPRKRKGKATRRGRYMKVLDLAKGDSILFQMRDKRDIKGLSVYLATRQRGSRKRFTYRTYVSGSGTLACRVWRIS